MLTEKEREAVAGFRQWAKALRDDDHDTLRKIEQGWHKDFVQSAISGRLAPYAEHF